LRFFNGPLRHRVAETTRHLSSVGSGACWGLMPPPPGRVLKGNHGPRPSFFFFMPRLPPQLKTWPRASGFFPRSNFKGGKGRFRFSHFGLLLIPFHVWDEQKACQCAAGTATHRCIARRPGNKLWAVGFRTFGLAEHQSLGRTFIPKGGGPIRKSRAPQRPHRAFPQKRRGGGKEPLGGGQRIWNRVGQTFNKLHTRWPRPVPAGPSGFVMPQAILQKNGPRGGRGGGGTVLGCAPRGLPGGLTALRRGAGEKKAATQKTSFYFGGVVRAAGPKT